VTHPLVDERTVGQVPLAQVLPPDEALRLDLQQTLQPAAAPWGVLTYLFTILSNDRPIGRLALRIGETPTITLFAGHLGLGIDEPHRGLGFARRAARLVLPLATAHRLDPMWITCSPHNAASIRAIESLGARYVETVIAPAGAVSSYQEEKQRYRLDLGST
jgi:predicted acetyltransferase